MKHLLRVSLFSVAVLSLIAPAGNAADAVDPLQFFKNYFVTGDYSSGGVGLRGLGVLDTATQAITQDPLNSHYSTGTIQMSGVPANADVVAAYLYWESMESSATPASSIGVFRKNRIVGKKIGPDGISACRGSGGGSGTTSGAVNLRVYRADVLRYLPIAPAGAVANPGRFVVNDNDLKTDGFSPHTLSVVDSGAGGSQSPGTSNQAIYAEGASLVVVYRVPAALAPLKAVILYDGAYTFNQVNLSMTQTLVGFYQASAKPVSKITYLVGDGDSNFKERLVFNNTTLSDNPFQGAQGASWDNLNFDVTLTENDYQATTSLKPVLSSVDCVSFGAIIFSTTVKDTDGDGLLDIWETSNKLVDPNTQDLLPDLHAMGADPAVPDIFVQIDYMKSDGYSTPLGTVPAHSHLPTKAALHQVGEAFLNAPAPPDGPGPIHIHFDVGNNYQGDPYVIPYVIPSNLAAGGHAIVETACVPSSTQTCQFPLYPGTMGWKSGFQHLKLSNFLRNRKDSFHYGLFAHTLGKPVAAVDDPNTPLDELHTPASTSGVSDAANGGGDFMITLGRWDDSVGSDFMQASTLMHELGHNFALRHGGDRLQANCKPNYQSVMNYLHQVGGLLYPPSTAAGKAGAVSSAPPVIDYSRQELQALDEASLVDGILKTTSGGTLQYLPRWNAPITDLDNYLGTSPMKKHCGGSPLTPLETRSMVRVDGTSLTAPIDWNQNGTVDTVSFSQDIDYNGGPNTVTGAPAEAKFTGFNDWKSLDLAQTASRQDANRLSLGVVAGDLAAGDSSAGSAADGSAADGSAADGSAADGSAADGSAADGSAADGSAADGSDLDVDTALSIGSAVAGLTATPTQKTIDLKWNRPNVVGSNAVVNYKIWRATGAITPTNLPVPLATTSSSPTSFSDTTAQNKRTYTYLVVAMFSDGSQSGPASVTVSR